MKCENKTCPGNATTPPQEHEVGDNECGYLNAHTGPVLKAPHTPTICRRPNCAKEFMSQEDRDKHEADPKPHRKRDMDFICDWNAHADAIQEHLFCPVCQ